MWFDCVLVDRIHADGELWSYHIRTDTGTSYPIDRLEDVDPNFTSDGTVDVGPLRVYGDHNAKITVLKTRPKNILIDQGRLCVHIDHYGIPLKAGYYACVFPEGWRIVGGHIYDPYHQEYDPSLKRSYRDVTFTHDPGSRMSCAQFEMISNRGTFSLGLMALLEEETWDGEFVDELRPLDVRFSDPRHQRHPLESLYRNGTDAAIRDSIESQPSSTVPGIQVGAFGISTNLTEWGKYLYSKMRRPPS